MVKNILQEKIAYNALNIYFKSDFLILADLLKLYGSWQKALLKEGASLDKEVLFGELVELGIELILPSEERFPKALRGILNPPLGIYYKGKLVSNDAKTIAFVGTRKASATGLNIAHNFAFDVAKNMGVVVSGLAFGVDSEAHGGALDAGGVTVAVLAVGLDKVYPTEHTGLAESIIKSGGLLVSEYPIGTVTYPSRFIARNRIIAGLSKAVVIIEAPARSGSISTANFARKFNRPVFAIPGAINNPNYIGSNDLIKKGRANLLTDSKELVRIVGGTKKTRQRTLTELSTLDKNCKIILTVLMSVSESIHPDKIAQECELDLSTINQSLSDLVLEGLVDETAGRYRAL